MKLYVNYSNVSDETLNFLIIIYIFFLNCRQLLKMHNVVDGVSKLICGTLFYTPYYYDFVLFKKPKNYKLQAATAKIIPPGKVYGLTGKHHIVYVCNTFIPLEN